MAELTLRNQVVRYKWRILPAYALVIVESLLEILYPLVIGLAINDLLLGSYEGILHLAGLGLFSIAIGSIRRFYEARTYSTIYSQIAPEMVDRELTKGSSISSIMARSSLLTEFTEFLEWSMPEVVSTAVYLIGILVIIANLNIKVFIGCLILLGLVVVVYLVTGKLNLRLNASYNDQLEQQVEALERRNSAIIKNYYKTLMKWNVKLSDLDTIEFMVVWFGVIALLVYTAIAVVTQDLVVYGLAFAVVLYVFDYIDVVITLPDHIQQLIRLNEISGRLSEQN